LPGKDHLLSGLALYVLADVLFKRLVIHPRMCGVVEKVSFV
jgi:hypothetical protein